MLSTEPYRSSYETYLNRSFDRLLTILPGHFARWIYSGHSCPHHHGVAIQIVSQIPQTNLGLDPDQANGPYNQPSRSLGLNPKDVFHTTPNSGTRSVPLSLSVRQCLVPASFTLKMLPILPFLQLLKLFLRTVRRVCPHISTAVILIQKILKDLTVMNRRGRHLITANQFMFHIHIDMILITVVVLAILLGPAGIRILLPLLLFAPVFWNLSLLDSLILLPTVPLFRHRNDTGVHTLPFPGREALFAKIRFKLVKGFLNHPGFGQLLPKQPDGLSVRNVISQRQIQESHKRETIPNLKLCLFVRQIVQRLKNQHLEHQHNIKGFSTRTGFPLFVSHHFQQRSKSFPVHHGLNPGERVTALVQLFKTYLPIQQTGLHHLFSPCLVFGDRNIPVVRLVEC